MIHRSAKIHPSSLIDSGASIGEDCSIGAFTAVSSGAEIGKGTVIESHCVIGSDGALNARSPLEVGKWSLIRSHSILYGGSEFGENLETGHRVTIRENTISGVGFRVGTLCDIQGDCVFGDYVRLHSNVHIGKGSNVGNFVWIFPYVVLTNDPHPPSDGFLNGPVVEDFAVIATMSTILPGVRVGTDSLVGAHSLVTTDVSPGELVVGSPAKSLGMASRIQLRDGSGPAYPWRRHFFRGYPDVVVAKWREEYRQSSELSETE